MGDLIERDIPDEFMELVREHGCPFYLHKNGQVRSLNDGFFAGLYANRNDIIYDPVERAFCLYNDTDGLYSEITENRIKKDIAKYILQLSREWRIPSLECMQKNSVLTGVVQKLKGITEKRDAFAEQPTFIHLGNCILRFDDSRAGFIKCDYSPDLHSRNQSPIHYDITAKCDRFINELLLPAVNEEDAILIQKYTGLCLLGNNLIQKLLILDGTAGRGKSTLALVIQKLIGVNNVAQLRTQHLSGRFETFRYLKKTLLTGLDVPGNFLSHEGSHIIKVLLGGDISNAEQKCGIGNFPFKGRYCIIITSNARLQVKFDGDLDAWRRRLLIVRVKPQSPIKKIPDFADQLIQDEGSGILNWALQGLKMLKKDMRQCGDIQLSKGQIKIVDALLCESDSLRHFLNDWVVADEPNNLTVAEIVEAYVKYCPTKGWHPKPPTVIYRELEKLMHELFHTVKSNSIMRQGKYAKGFRKVGFKKQ